MFGFDVLTWNSGYGKGSYSASVEKAMFGGSTGHAAAELIIPLTEENKKLLDEVNRNGSGNLIVREETTLVPRPIDEEPFFRADEVPCYRVYFSFWGDVKSKRSPEQHRMIDAIRDRIEEGEGIPVEYNDLGRRVFKDDPEKLNTVNNLHYHYQAQHGYSHRK